MSSSTVQRGLFGYPSPGPFSFVMHLPGMIFGIFMAFFCRSSETYGNVPSIKVHCVISFLHPSYAYVWQDQCFLLLSNLGDAQAQVLSGWDTDQCLEGHDGIPPKKTS